MVRGLIPAAGEPIYGRQARSDHELCAIINRRRKEMRLLDIHARPGIIREHLPAKGKFTAATHRYKTIISTETRSDLVIVIEEANNA